MINHASINQSRGDADGAADAADALDCRGDTGRRGQWRIDDDFIDPEVANIAKIRAYVDSRMEKIEAGQLTVYNLIAPIGQVLGHPSAVQLGPARHRGGGGQGRIADLVPLDAARAKRAG